MKVIWEYIHGYSSTEPELITFYDPYDETLYRNISLKVIGQHGWELVSVFVENEGHRREFYFKRNRNNGYDSGIALKKEN